MKCLFAKQTAFFCFMFMAFSYSHEASASVKPESYIDLTPFFEKFLEKAKDKTPQEQAKIFKKEVVEAYPGILTANTFHFDAAKPFDQSLAERLEVYMKKIQSITTSWSENSKSAQNLVGQSLAAFSKEFPEAQTPKLFLIPNLGATECDVVSTSGKPLLLIGVDTITLSNRSHQGDTKISALLHQELLTQYQKQLHAKDSEFQKKPLYWELWTNGLSAYTTKHLNPEISVDDLKISEFSIADVIAKKSDIINQLSQSLHSTAPELKTAYFSEKSKDENVPEMAGIYIGYLIAKELNQKQPLELLAKMNSKTLSKVLPDTLSKIAKDSYVVDGNL